MTYNISMISQEFMPFKTLIQRMNPSEHEGSSRIPKKFMAIHILSHTMVSDGYRQTERLLNAHPNWLKVFDLEKAFSHSIISKFRKKMGSEFFDAQTPHDAKDPMSSFYSIL